MVAGRVRSPAMLHKIIKMKIAKIRFSYGNKKFDKGQVVDLPEDVMVKISRLVEDSEVEKVEKVIEPEKNEIKISTEKVKRKRKNAK